MKEADDFLDETRVLQALVEVLDEPDFGRATQFKSWTVDDVIGHLHLFNVAAELALGDREGFEKLVAPVLASIGRGEPMLTSQWKWLGDMKGRMLAEAWVTGAESLARAYANTDPKTRVKWLGPEMSARSAITARQMETWAHGQEVFDLMGVRRREHDRIRNIVVLGVNTFAWSFANRKLPAPEEAPRLDLVLPSGDRWTWNPDSGAGAISGKAVEFAQVVTQVRNVVDTELTIEGDTASRWMTIAQCFAGPPVDPPAPGTRHANG